MSFSRFVQRAPHSSVRIDPPSDADDPQSVLLHNHSEEKEDDAPIAPPFSPAPPAPTDFSEKSTVEQDSFCGTLGTQPTLQPPRTPGDGGARRVVIIEDDDDDSVPRAPSTAAPAPSAAGTTPSVSAPGPAPAPLHHHHPHSTVSFAPRSPPPPGSPAPPADPPARQNSSRPSTVGRKRAAADSLPARRRTRKPRRHDPPATGPGSLEVTIRLAGPATAAPGVPRGLVRSTNSPFSPGVLVPITRFFLARPTAASAQPSQPRLRRHPSPTPPRRHPGAAGLPTRPRPGPAASQPPLPRQQPLSIPSRTAAPATPRVSLPEPRPGPAGHPHLDAEDVRLLEALAAQPKPPASAHIKHRHRHSLLPAASELHGAAEGSAPARRHRRQAQPPPRTSGAPPLPASVPAPEPAHAPSPSPPLPRTRTRPATATAPIPAAAGASPSVAAEPAAPPAPTPAPAPAVSAPPSLGGLPPPPAAVPLSAAAAPPPAPDSAPAPAHPPPSPTRRTAARPPGQARIAWALDGVKESDTERDTAPSDAPPAAPPVSPGSAFLAGSARRPPAPPMAAAAAPALVVVPPAALSAVATSISSLELSDSAPSGGAAPAAPAASGGAPAAGPEGDEVPIDLDQLPIDWDMDEVTLPAPSCPLPASAGPATDEVPESVPPESPAPEPVWAEVLRAQQLRNHQAAVVPAAPASPAPPPSPAARAAATSLIASNRVTLRLTPRPSTPRPATPGGPPGTPLARPAAPPRSPGTPSSQTSNSTLGASEGPRSPPGGMPPESQWVAPELPTSEAEAEAGGLLPAKQPLMLPPASPQSDDTGAARPHHRFRPRSGRKARRASRRALSEEQLAQQDEDALAAADGGAAQDQDLQQQQAAEAAAQQAAYDPFLAISRFPPLPSLPRKRGLLPPMRPEHAGRMTVVLDLDETLVHCDISASIANADIGFEMLFNGEPCKIAGIKRPGWAEFLHEVAALFEVVCFTASQEVYANTILDMLDPGHTIFSQRPSSTSIRTPCFHRLFREACLNVDGNFVKDLEALGRDMRRLVIVDNTPQAFGYHLDSGIPIATYLGEPDDCLGAVLGDLRELALQSDVRPWLRQRYGLADYVAEAIARAAAGGVPAAAATPLSCPDTAPDDAAAEAVVAPISEQLAKWMLVNRHWRDAILRSPLWFTSVAREYGDKVIDRYLFTEDDAPSPEHYPAFTDGRFWMKLTEKHHKLLRVVEKARRKEQQRMLRQIPRCTRGQTDEMLTFVGFCLVGPFAILGFLAWLILVMLQGEGYIQITLHGVVAPLDAVAVGGVVAFMVMDARTPIRDAFHWMLIAVGVAIALAIPAAHWVASRYDWSAANPGVAAPAGLSYLWALSPAIAGTALVTLAGAAMIITARNKLDRLASVLVVLLPALIVMAQLVLAGLGLQGSVATWWPTLLVPVHLVAGLAVLGGLIMLVTWLCGRRGYRAAAKRLAGLLLTAGGLSLALADATVAARLEGVTSMHLVIVLILGIIWQVERILGQTFGAYALQAPSHWAPPQSRFEQPRWSIVYGAYWCLTERALRPLEEGPLQSQAQAGRQRGPIFFDVGAALQDQAVDDEAPERALSVCVCDEAECLGAVED
ncbi:putative nuclear lim interactor-interacting protein [Paratrimastix pyriformis]|uniref:Nuclear lim interactor-interacting protein n=1 Tax=Paratrimastix pyriformis TaxID=342808 RepID=A0ABQ8UW54_9EUKA|nr:putative nuclear lim interactor-interacting protein [Paratrimastix pyriformis]